MFNAMAVLVLAFFLGSASNNLEGFDAWVGYISTCFLIYVALQYAVHSLKGKDDENISRRS